MVPCCITQNERHLTYIKLHLSEKQTFLCHITETANTKHPNTVFWNLGFIRIMFRAFS